MRLLIASLAALTAVALAAPSFAQETSPTPTPLAKPKAGTAAQCKAQKSTTAREACLKRLQASAASSKAKAKAKKPTDPAAKPANAAENPASATPPQSVSVPPLPAKVI